MTLKGREATEPPYEGALGATRYEPVLVVGSDGVARRMELVRGVDADADPNLAEAAREGTLHVLPDGALLAVPFVYHDPAARRFALVIPPERAHEEFVLRAELLQQLSRDVSVPVPAYVREAHAVLGPEGLRRYLAGELADSRVEARLEALRQREERLRERAEALLLREDELRDGLEALAQNREELLSREEHLSRRESALIERETALVREDTALRNNRTGLTAREAALQLRQQELDERERRLLEREAALPSPEEASEEADPLEEEGMETAASSEDPDGLLDDAEPIEPAEDLPDHPDAQEPAEEALEAEEMPSEPEPPRLPETWGAKGKGALAAVIDGEVRFWALGRVGESAPAVLGRANLVLQADPASSLPLALLSVHREEGAPLASVVLDGTRPDDRAVLEALARDFRVRVELVTPARRSLGSCAVGGEGEATAQRVRAVLLDRATGTEEERRSTAAKLLENGLVDASLAALEQSLREETELATAAGATRALQALTTAMEPSTADRLTLLRGLDPARVDVLAKRILLGALRAGVMLTPALVEKAISLGIASDEASVCHRALAAFSRSCLAGPALRWVEFCGSIGRMETAFAMGRARWLHVVRRSAASSSGGVRRRRSDGNDSTRSTSSFVD